MKFAYFCVCMFFPFFKFTFDQNYFADKRRNKKKKPRAKQGEETARMDDQEMESKQEVDSGAEEPTSDAAAMEDEGRYECLMNLVQCFMLNSNAVDMYNSHKRLLMYIIHTLSQKNNTLDF